MAEKQKNEKKDEKPKPKKHNSGEMSFAMEFLLLIVALFILWMFLGGPKSDNTDQPFMQDQSIMNTQ